MSEKQFAITAHKSICLLSKWVNQLHIKYGTSVEIRLNSTDPVGTGRTIIDFATDTRQIVIGTNDICQAFPTNLVPTNGMNLVRAGIVLFHEAAHYERHANSSTRSEILISELSKYGNPNYYAQSWSELPHEIDAEFTGVVSMWNALESEFPDKADACMLRFVNWWAANTDYMIRTVPGGYASRAQVEDAFDRAYETSLCEPRRFQPGFLRYEDEVSRLLTNESVLRFEYREHYKKLVGNVPGAQKDQMMASLVLHLHPELGDAYPKRIVKALNAETAFGFPLPESPDESRMHFLNDAFASEIDHLSDQFQKGIVL